MAGCTAGLLFASSRAPFCFYLPFFSFYLPFCLATPPVPATGEVALTLPSGRSIADEPVTETEDVDA